MKKEEDAFLLAREMVSIGNGAKRNGEPMTPSSETDLTKISLGGFTKSKTLSVSKLVDTARRMRVLGSVVLELAYVASGKYDANGGVVNCTNNVPGTLENGKLTINNVKLESDKLIKLYITFLCCSIIKGICH